MPIIFSLIPFFKISVSFWFVEVIISCHQLLLCVLHCVFHTAALLLHCNRFSLYSPENVCLVFFLNSLALLLFLSHHLPITFSCLFIASLFPLSFSILFFLCFFLFSVRLCLFLILTQLFWKEPTKIVHFALWSVIEKANWGIVQTSEALSPPQMFHQFVFLLACTASVFNFGIQELGFP